MAFRVGQKVVCVDDSIKPGEPGPYVKLGEIYTISSIQIEHGEYTLLFEELEPISVDDWDTGYMPEFFRPIVEKKTDISIFQDILRKVSRKVRA